jgi:hypothetical protein
MPTSAKKKVQKPVAEPPAWHNMPLLNGTDDVKRWLDHYWNKLGLPAAEQLRLALTQDRREFARWTGRRLNPLALGCYCYLPGSSHDTPPATLALAAMEQPLVAECGVDHQQLFLPGMTLPSFPRSRSSSTARHRHLIFIEPELEVMGTEVTVAHELIHLADRFRGQPRRHHCHGYDSIANDEAAITGYDPELLRQLLRDESNRRESVLRASRPVRYIYLCSHCNKEYPRVRRYPRPVSCGSCDRSYNPRYLLVLHSIDGQLVKAE